MKTVFAALSLAFAIPLFGAPIKVTDLRTERLTSPSGVGTTPRISWKLVSDEIGKRQIAYEVLAATSLEKLTPKTADLWNSGQQKTGLRNFVPWKGKTLDKIKEVYWQVRVWDEKKEVGPWSKPTRFMVGGKKSLPKPARASSFKSSSPELNQLYAASIAKLKKRLASFTAGDLAGLGNGAQVHRASRAMLFHYDATPHLTEWIRLMDESLTKDNFFPIQPGSKKVGSVSSDAAIIAHHPLWWMGGDSSYTETRWKNYEKHMMARENRDLQFKGTKWGESVDTEGMTAEFIDLAYLGFTTRLVRELAAPAQQPLNVIRFKDYAARIRKSFEQQYVNEDGSLKVPSQSAHVLALRSAVLKPEQQKKVIADLLSSLSKNGVQVGPIGAHFLPGVLSLTGNQETAIKILKGLKKEQQQAFTGNGVSAWLMAYLAGIDSSSFGFQQIIFAPRIPSDDSVTWVKASHETPAGKMAIHWEKLKNGSLKVNITVPTGIIARIILPGRKDGKLTVNGKKISEVTSVEIIKQTDQAISLISQSGTYSFLIE